MFQDVNPGPGTYLGLVAERPSETSFSNLGTGSFASKVGQSNTKNLVIYNSRPIYNSEFI